MTQKIWTISNAPFGEKTEQGNQVAELTLEEGELFRYNDRYVAAAGDKVTVIRWSDGGVDVRVA